VQNKNAKTYRKKAVGMPEGNQVRQYLAHSPGAIQRVKKTTIRGETDTTPNDRSPPSKDHKNGVGSAKVGFGLGGTKNSGGGVKHGKRWAGGGTWSFGKGKIPYRKRRDQQKKSRS